ncbi:MAG: LacI family transcriptional regulator [Rhizobiaceae bacterium]|nr:LacI family transcriptional regulator [Rhizobiaceae bacterium]
MSRDGTGRGPVTIRDIARHLGMSHPTVSRALNDSPEIGEETKEKVRAAARAMGYIPNSWAQMMRRQKSSLVGLIVPDIENPFYSRLSKIIADEAASRGVQLVMAISEDDPALEYRHIVAMRRARVAGIALTPTAGLTPESAELLEEIPAMQIVRRSPVLSKPLTVADDRGATAQSARHLIEMGHRRIALVSGGPETLSTGEERVAGFMEAVDAANIRHLAMIELGSPRPAFGYAATLRLIDRPDPPTGIVIGSSQLMLGVMRALRERGLSVPSDMSMIGYGDPEWLSEWGGGITTISLPVEQIASNTARFLCAQVETASAEVWPERTEFPTTLVIRGSVAAPVT